MGIPLYGQNKAGDALNEAQKSFDNRVHLMATAANNMDLSGETEGDKIVIISAAQADGTYLRLPEATTSNGGMHIRVVFGIAVADDFAVGCVTSNLIGGATAVGDTNEAVGGAADHASCIGDVGDTFKSVRFNLDTVAAAGGTGGTVLDFYYTGQANLIVYSGSLISEIDAPTLTGHLVTTVVTS
tara:strand:+ start:471 stop:1025 length:555 start_codon:yes stop_codon:yes gene_type:complete